MILFNFIVVLGAVLPTGTLFVTAVRVVPITAPCLKCIRESLITPKYTPQGCNGDVCGMYCITWPFWVDAGKPTLSPGDNPDATDAYSKCTCDPTCATTTVKNYMNTFAQDCNGDGEVNCIDYALIHWLGGYGCQKSLNNEFIQKFYACYKRMKKDCSCTRY